MAIHRIDIVDGLIVDSAAANNFLCCIDCQTVTCTFQNVHNSALTINDFVVDPILPATKFTYTVTAINGGPVTWGFVVGVDEFFTLTLEICYSALTPGTDDFTANFVTAEHGDDAAWLFGFACVNFNDLGVPLTLDFGSVPPSTTTTQSFTITNTTIGDVPFVMGSGTCPSITFDPGSGTIAAGASQMIDVDWSAGAFPDSISCNIDVTSDGASQCVTSISVIGATEEIICEDCICCVDIEIRTENNWIDTQTGFCDPSNFYYPASFLEKKTVVFKMSYVNPIFSGWQLQFNPRLFGDDCTAPFEENQPLPTSYRVTYAASIMPDGTPVPMSLFGAGINALNQKNWEVNFVPVNAAIGAFNVELTFYMIEDYEQWISNIAFPNADKLRKNTISAASVYDNSFPSVYNTLKNITGAFFITDPAVLVGDSPLRCSLVTCPRITGRFYNLGLYGGPSEFTNPQFILSRSTGNVTNFSTVEKTRVEFRIDIDPSYGTGTPVIVYHVFDESATDNNVDFFAASDSSRYRVLGYAGTGVLDNHLVRPGTIGSVGGTWTASLYVGTTVNASSIYRVAAIVYGSNGTMVNTFLSDRIVVKNVPDLDCDCELEFESGWNQYFQLNQVDAFRPVGKERVGHRVTTTGDSMADCMANWGFDITNWNDALLTIRLNIYKRRENFPSVGQTTFFQYETHLSQRNNAFPGGWQNNNDLEVIEIGSTITTRINNRRVRWENNLFTGGLIQTANTATYLNRTNAGPLGSTYVGTLNILDSWIGEDVFFEYIYTFNFTPYLGTPFFWNVVRAFPLNAIGFEPINSGFDQRLTDVTIEGLNPTTGNWELIEPPICFQDWLQLRLTYQADREGNFIFFIEREPFGLPLLQENDGASSNTLMTELSSPLVVSQDTVFDPVTFQASVILDAQQFAIGEKYLFCGYISSPEEPPTCEYFIYHAEVNSVGISLNPITLGSSIPATFTATPLNSYFYMRTSNGPTTYPTPANIYVFEYSFTAPTTRVIDIWFGQWAFGGTPQISLPVGSTSGAIPITWGLGGSGEWTLRAGAGTNMTTVGTFKIGNAYCP